MRWILGLAAVAAAGQLYAAEIVVDIYQVGKQGVGDKAGTVTLKESADGVILEPDLSGLPPGPHGFHLHENGSCEPAEKDGEMTAAAAAGGHFDPDDTGRHAGPYGDGHLGDLPVLYVRADGSASDPVLAPRLTIDDMRGRALMIHQGADNYKDEPEPLGGGGARIACGVVPE